jgi:hypothetical protein
MPTSSPIAQPGATAGGVAVLLRAESLAMLLALVVTYRGLHGSWGLFAALFLLPDLAMLPYLKSSAAGATAYNAAHTFSAPVAVALAGVLTDSPHALQIATIWGAHIAFDRMLGYGLKYSTAFGDIHLGLVVRA